METLRIFGAGVRASVVVDLIHWHFADQIAVEGFYDDRRPVGTTGPGGYPVLGTVENGIAAVSQERMLRTAFVALGTRASARGCQVFLELRDRGVRLLNLVAPTAHVSPSARIGDNALVLPGVFVGCGATIGHLFCAHGGAVVEHHGRVGHNVLLGPNVAIASRANIASHVFIGAGCAIVPQITVGSGTLLGAGAVVVRDVPAHAIAFGQPATPIREVRPGDEVPVAADIQILAEKGLEEWL